MADATTLSRVRQLAPHDLDEVIRIDAAHSSTSKPEYWREVFARYLHTRTRTDSFGLGIDSPLRIEAATSARPSQGGASNRQPKTARPRPSTSVDLPADPSPPGLAAFLFGEVRAFEFGAGPAGWIFAVGVDPSHARKGLARTLLREAKARFAALGVGQVRTMVRRDDVPILAFFRTAGFVGGPFVQLELLLEDDA